MLLRVRMRDRQTGTETETETDKAERQTDRENTIERHTERINRGSKSGDNDQRLTQRNQIHL
jgi:hypothetical protein